jgi:hypothetical protein
MIIYDNRFTSGGRADGGQSAHVSSWVARMARRQSWRGLAVGVWLLSALASGTSALALECPRPQPSTNAGAIQESPADIAKLSSTLTHPTGGAVAFAVAHLRHEHPHAKNGEILNYLITAYCPVINNDAGKSERQKRTDLRRFNKQVMRLVYN